MILHSLSGKMIKIPQPRRRHSMVNERPRMFSPLAASSIRYSRSSSTCHNATAPSSMGTSSTSSAPSHSPSPHCNIMMIIVRSHSYYYYVVISRETADSPLALALAWLLWAAASSRSIS
eukprot:CAMPEP_0185265936 /NCGR_PEP_ID=MMETSP1359-20130426/29349_1 /TAXON_ID=552665 /ORGANISM="Bigelowiella longifila, Strain CCMP242" /LENGTH=118 /DNA_ID=CAMNT_0027855493 /DNA_START=56 /DNA_END=408 /DNA_ORIENTATION=-